MAGIEIKRVVLPVTVERFESAEIDISDAVTRVAHGLVGKPDVVRLVARCKVAQEGYAIGEEVEVVPVSAGTDSTIGSLVSSSTEVIFGHSSYERIYSLATGSQFSVSSGDWVYVIYAMRWG